MWLLENAGRLNLAWSLLILLAGAAVFWLVNPKLFQEHPYTKRAFVFWLFQWFMLIVIWKLYVLGSHASCALLACIDLYAIAGLGFYWAYRKANNFDWQGTVKTLGGIYGALLLWNLLVGTLAEHHNSAYDKLWHWAWILPSETASAFVLILTAAIFLLRFGPPAVPIACVALPIYAFLQRPTYSAMFIGEKSDPGWVLALGCGKLVYGLLFYTLFFSPARDYGHVELPHFETRRPALMKSVKWAAGIMVTAVLSTLATTLAESLGNFIKGH